MTSPNADIPKSVKELATEYGRKHGGGKPYLAYRAFLAGWRAGFHTGHMGGYSEGYLDGQNKRRREIEDIHHAGHGWGNIPAFEKGEEHERDR